MPKGIPRDQSTQHKILHRLKITRGHLDHVIEMVKKNEYCIDVINQSLAVQSALKQVDQVMLENHIKTCMSDAIKKGKMDEAVEEVLKIMEKRN